MGKEIKTIEQWLNELPEPYRTQAIENILNQFGKKRLKVMETSLKYALQASFLWHKSEQGRKYWENLYNSL